MAEIFSPFDIYAEEKDDGKSVRLSTEDSDSRLEGIVRPEFEEFEDDPPSDDSGSSRSSINLENGKEETDRHSSSSRGSSLSSQPTVSENEKITGVRELARLVYTFDEERQAQWMGDFNEFLIRKNRAPLFSVRDRDTARLLHQMAVNLYQSGLRDLPSLARAHRGDLRYPVSLVDGEPSLNYDWLVSVLKYSDESFYYICNMFCETHYSDAYVDATGGRLLRHLSERFLFFMHFFSRLPDVDYEYVHQVPLNLHCPFCLLTGNHFPNECHVKYSRELKVAHLAGYCKRCNDGPFCSGLHEKELQCINCEQPGYETEMCPCSDDANERTYSRLKYISVALRGWNTQMLRKLFLDLKHWSSRKKMEHPTAGKFVYYKEFLKHQKKFHHSLWKIFDFDEPQASNDSDDDTTQRSTNADSSSTDSDEEDYANE